jgi:hypothetical protein
MLFEYVYTDKVIVELKIQMALTENLAFTGNDCVQLKMTTVWKSWVTGTFTKA